MLFAHDAGIDRPRRIDANGAAGGNLLMRGNTFQLNWLSVTRQKTRARCNPGLANGVASTEAHISESEASYREALAAETAGNWCSSIVSQLKAQRSLAKASCFVEGALELFWRTSSVSTEADAATEASRQKLSDQAEEFLVGRAVLFHSHMFPQMTNLAGLSLVSLLLMLLAVSCYPFQPHQLIVLFNWTGFLPLSVLLCISPSK
jgi:hypothetical protein